MSTQCTQNCLDPCFFSIFFPYEGVHKQRRLREREGQKERRNMDDAAKFVDSLSRTVKTEQGNDKIFFFFLAEFAHSRCTQTSSLRRWP